MEIWQFDQGRLSFLLSTLTDLLPSPANLKQWQIEESANCHLCKSPDCTLNHILSSCPRAVFPQDIVATKLRPDILLTSRNKNLIVIMELTVPWEDRLELSHQLKKGKYQDLADEAQMKGWHALLFPFEAGCKGFPSKSLHYLLHQLGMIASETRKAVKSTGAVAESSSRWLWLMRTKEWTPTRD